MIDYYAILNIEPTASKNEIKEAFKKKALKWHPDRNKSSNATAKMQLVNEAYLILKDIQARQRYDKQYYQFLNQKNKGNKQEENQQQSYTSNDDILNNWIKKAKRQAQEMVMMSIEDLIGISKVATNAAWEETKYIILIVIIANILFALLIK